MIELFVKTQVVGYHLWQDAPDEVSFLRNPHRHRFFIRVGAIVNHEERDIEFFMFQRKIKELLESSFVQNAHKEYIFGAMSCETIASIILNQLGQASYVEVSEDDENGAIVYKEALNV